MYPATTTAVSDTPLMNQLLRKCRVKQLLEMQRAQRGKPEDGPKRSSRGERTGERPGHQRMRNHMHLMMIGKPLISFLVRSAGLALNSHCNRVFVQDPME